MAFRVTGAFMGLVPFTATQSLYSNTIIMQIHYAKLTRASQCLPVRCSAHWLILPFKCGFFLCMNFENLVVSHSRCARGSENFSSPLKQVGPSSSLAVPVQRTSKVARPALQLQHTTHMTESKTNLINGQLIKKIQPPLFRMCVHRHWRFPCSQ